MTTTFVILSSGHETCTRDEGPYVQCKCDSFWCGNKLRISGQFVATLLLFPQQLSSSYSSRACQSLLFAAERRSMSARLPAGATACMVMMISLPIRRGSFVGIRGMNGDDAKGGSPSQQNTRTGLASKFGSDRNKHISGPV